MSKAQFLVATWTLLSRPYGDTFTPIWPVAGEWLPGHFVEETQRALPLHSVEGKARTHGHTVIHVPDKDALYTPPEQPARSAALRAAVFAAERRSAMCLLAASWSLYLGAHPQGQLQWMDKLVLVVRAREALCDAGDSSSAHALKRWQTLSANIDLGTTMTDRGFDQQDVAAVTDVTWNLRNLGAHSADSALVALGYPSARAPSFRGGPQLSGHQLGPLHIRERVEPAYAAVHIAAADLWQRMLDSDFDDRSWEIVLEG